MKKPENKFLNTANSILALIYLIIMVFFYRGFFFPDTILMESNSFFRLISLGVKSIFPVLTVGLFLIYRGIYLGKIQLASLILSIISIIIFLLVIYPLGEYFYKKRYEIDSSEYHTFLQLTPPFIREIDSLNYNIFCLGGSTTEFKDEEGRDWPSLVEKELLLSNSSKQIAVYNLGRQWYTTQHSLINYQQNLRNLKPDMIIILHTINDLLNNADFSKFSNGKFREDYGHFLGPEVSMIKYGSLAQFIFENIKLLWYQNPPEEITTDYFPGLISFERNLMTFLELAEKDKTQIVLMTQPNLYKEKMTIEELRTLTMLNKEAIGNGKRWTYQTALSGMKQYNNKIREITVNKEIKLIDLEKNIPKSLEYFYDDVHYNKKTYDLIGKVVAENLNEIIFK